MMCSSMQVHNLIQRIERGDEDSANSLCSCFRPEIRREAKRVSHQNTKVIEEEICERLILGIKTFD